MKSYEHTLGHLAGLATTREINSYDYRLNLSTSLVP